MYDLVVIGGGAGGLHLAKMAAKVGARVALIEKNRPGEAGLSAACVPSKGLTQAAKLAGQIRGAERFGLGTGPIDVDFAALMARLTATAEVLADRDSGAALESLGIDVFHGPASFEAYDTLSVGGSRPVSGHRLVIATGSRPAVPEIPGLAEAGYFDEHNLLSLSTRPAHLIVLGSETIAIEFAQSFARLGSNVTVLSPAPAILSSYESEASYFVQQALSREGIAFELGVDVKEVEARGGQTLCKFTRRSSGAAGEVAGSHLLVATGRLANVEDLNLEVVGVHGDTVHGIEVDDCLQTHSARIFAIGDVLLRHRYANAAEREAEVVFQNAVLKLKKKIDYSRLPIAAFIDPELASVGVTEEQARPRRFPARSTASTIPTSIEPGSTAGSPVLPRWWRRPPARCWGRPSWAKTRV